MSISPHIGGTTLMHSDKSDVISTSNLSRIICHILRKYPDRCKLDPRLFSTHFTPRKFVNAIVSEDYFEYGRFDGPEHFDKPAIRQTNRWNMQTILRSARCGKVSSKGEAFSVMQPIWEHAIELNILNTMTVEYKIFKLATLFRYLPAINELSLRYRLSIPMDIVDDPTLYICDDKDNEIVIPYRGNGLLSYIIDAIQTIMDTHLQISRRSKTFTTESLNAGLDALADIVQVIPVTNIISISTKSDYDASLNLEWFRHVELQSNDRLLNGMRFYTQPREDGWDILVDKATTFTKLYLMTQHM